MGKLLAATAVTAALALGACGDSGESTDSEFPDPTVEGKRATVEVGDRQEAVQIVRKAQKDWPENWPPLQVDVVYAMSEGERTAGPGPPLGPPGTQGVFYAYPPRGIKVK